MKKICLVLAAVMFSTFGAAAQNHSNVQKKDFTSTVKFERMISGHLTELNGKYKLRAVEITVAPGGYLGEHHHAGPGIRLVKSGTLTYVQSDSTKAFGPGEYFYESGDVTHAVYNKTSAPVEILSFEVVPADWKGSSAIPPVSGMVH